MSHRRTTAAGFVLGCFFCVPCAAANGADPPAASAAPATTPAATKATKATTVTVALHPAPEPRPALRHRLWPTLLEEKPGNAAPYYYRAVLALANVPKESRETFDKRYDEWLKQPSAELPLEEIRRSLAPFDAAWKQAEIAAGRESCDWGLRFGDVRGTESVAFTLQEFQELRTLARLAAVRARVEIAGQRPDRALDAIRLGFRLADDCRKVPILINGLIGAAIAGMMQERLLELSQAPDAPNLYWAIATLPRPFVDLHDAMRQEMEFAVMIFPFLGDAETKSRSPAEWDREFDAMFGSLRDLGQLGSFGSGDGPQAWIRRLGERAARAALLTKAYVDARPRLTATGFSKEQLDAMPPLQVVGIDMARTYQYVRDETFKWSFLPPAQAHALSRAAEEKLRREGYLGGSGPNWFGTSKEVIPIASLLLPAVTNVWQVQIRTERRMAELQTLEALRMHAATHEGRLPQTLDELSPVPALHDPFTGRPFEYVVDGKQAVLSSTPAVGEMRPDFARRYEITIAK